MPPPELPPLAEPTAPGAAELAALRAEADALRDELAALRERRAALEGALCGAPSTRARTIKPSFYGGVIVGMAIFLLLFARWWDGLRFLR